MNVNQVTLVGRLTRDPEVKELENDNAVAKFGLAITRTFGSGDKKKEEVTFVDCVAWGNAAKIIERYVHKGDLLGITGRLQLDKWEDKKTGEARSQIKVVADNISLGPKRNGASEEEGDEQNGPAFINKGKAANKPTGKFKKPAPEEADEGAEEEAAATVRPTKRPF